ncbi:MAG TPA: NYN domain-containing protein, partial [Coriobacteriia bacterium]
MLFLVDGYNVTRRDPATSELSLEDQREALVARLRVRGRDLLGVGRIVVVFDGEGGPGLSTGGGVPVEIVYAHKHSADDEVVRIAAKAKDAVVVVTSDRDLARRAGERATVHVEVREASTCFDA